MIKRIAYQTNTKFSNLYLIIENRVEYLDMVLGPELENQYYISLSKILRDFPVIEIHDDGTETKIDYPTLRQVIEAINPRQLEEIKHKNGNQYLVIITPISLMDEADGTSTFDEVVGLARLLRSSNIDISGKVYSYNDYVTSIEWD